MTSGTSSTLDKTSRLAAIAVGIIAVGVALSLAQDIVAPVFLALTTTIVMAPVIDMSERAGVSRAIGAFACLILAICVVVVLAFVLQPIVVQMMEQAPQVLRDIETSLRHLRALARDLSAISKDVAQAMQVEGGQAAEADAMPSVTDALLLAPSLMAQGIMFGGTLFFALLTRHEIYPWLAKVSRVLTRDHFVAAEREVSRYFLTITFINAGLGLAVGVMLSILGLPGAVQWGLLAFFVNFIVYLGPAVFAASLLYAGVAAFDGPYSALPAVLYLVLNMTEGQFVTPSLVGREMQINPLVVFLAVTFGLWFWGVVGGIVAIPTLVFCIELRWASKRQDRPQRSMRG